jgi:hypothetical protein
MLSYKSQLLEIEAIPFKVNRRVILILLILNYLQVITHLLLSNLINLVIILATTVVYSLSKDLYRV